MSKPHHSQRGKNKKADVAVDAPILSSTSNSSKPLVPTAEGSAGIFAGVLLWLLPMNSFFYIIVSIVFVLFSGHAFWWVLGRFNAPKNVRLSALVGFLIILVGTLTWGWLERFKRLDMTPTALVAAQAAPATPSVSPAPPQRDHSKDVCRKDVAVCQKGDRVSIDHMSIDSDSPCMDNFGDDLKIKDPKFNCTPKSKK